MNNKINEQTNNQAGKPGNEFNVGDVVRFRKGAPQEIFGDAIYTINRVFVDPEIKTTMIETNTGIKRCADIMISVDSNQDEGEEQKDEEIIKSLECCFVNGCCEKCNFLNMPDCVSLLTGGALKTLMRYRALIIDCAKTIFHERESLKLACDCLKCENCFMKDNCLSLEIDGEKTISGCCAMFHTAIQVAINKDFFKQLGK